MLVMDDFEKLLSNVILVCLRDLLGTTAANAMNFYLDPSVAAKDPDGYASRLISITGPNSSNVILKRIQDSLCEKVGLPKQTWKSFAQCVFTARKQANL